MLGGSPKKQRKLKICPAVYYCRFRVGKFIHSLCQTHLEAPHGIIPMAGKWSPRLPGLKGFDVGLLTIWVFP